MIEKLTIRNFKSWEICDLEFGKVTALFGANSSGKTSILQFLLMLKQTASSRDRRIFNFGGDERDFVDLGSYESAVHGHDVSKGIGFDLAWRPHQSVISEQYPFLFCKAGKLSVTYIYTNSEIKLLSRALQAQLDEIYNEAIESDDQSQAFLELVELTGDKYISRVNPTDNKTTNLSEAHIDSFYNTSMRTNGTGINIAVENTAVSVSLETLFESIYYLGPLRAYPQREYRWTGERPSTVGVRGEFAVQTMLADLVAGTTNGNQTQGKLLASANVWLKRLGVVEEIELRPVGEKSRLYEVIVKSPNFKHEANLADVGFGVSQVLPIVVMGHLVPEGSLIILEQPELHLHPNVQTQLADFFLELSVERNIQFLIESHSERLMQRLQQLLVEKPGKLAPLKDNDLRFYFCRRDPDSSVLEPVHSDLDGSITNIPGDFYDSVLPFLQQLEADGLGTEPIDISADHDEYVAQPSVRVLRDKDDQSE